jgi:hypothetical protein
MPLDPAPIYQQLGQFVVLFQLVENYLVRIAEILIDPNLTGNGRVVLAGLGFRDLAVKANVLFALLTEKVNTPEAEKKQKEFDTLTKHCLELAALRNKLVHSTYVHLEAGGELQVIFRSKAKLVTGGPEGPRYTFDQEQLTDVSLDDALKDIAETAFALSTFQRQVLLFQKMTGFRNERGI